MGLKHKGSRAKIWKFLDMRPLSEIVVGADLCGLNKRPFAGAPNADGKCRDDQGNWVTRLHPATWKRYMECGWVTETRTLTKKGLQYYFAGGWRGGHRDDQGNWVTIRVTASAEPRAECELCGKSLYDE
jgi:hypothetical protein